MREKTKAGIKVALRVLIVMPVLWFVLTSIAGMLGQPHAMPFSHLVPLMILFGAFGVYNVVKME